jgi:hypothetical protein
MTYALAVSMYVPSPLMKRWAKTLDSFDFWQSPTNMVIRPCLSTPWADIAATRPTRMMSVTSRQSDAYVRTYHRQLR